jgi:alpha-tubulin suppressor-like RCC1 family protein
VCVIVAASWMTCALHQDGNVSCWGQGWRGVLGDGLQVDRLSPVAVKWSLSPKRSRGLPAGLHVRTIAVNSFMSCAGLDDGSVRCWGMNGMNDIAEGLDASLPTPVVVSNLANVTALSLEGRPSALLGDGRVVHWGMGKPMAPANGLDHVAQFVSGGMVSCVRFDDGRATCDGYQIAPGQTMTHVTFVDVEHATACALLEDRTVACAGYNGKGQLGDASRTDHRETFGKVKDLRDVVQLSLGVEHACARIADGSVKCWGESMAAGVGDGIQEVPKTIPGLKDVVDIDAGGSASCARLRDGAVKCWGRYDFGAGMDAPKVPALVPWLHGVARLALGMFHSCALGSDGTVLCWGENQHGELGDGTNDNRSTAVRVSF